MNIPQLTTTRLQISLQSIQNDPTINDNLKLIFKNIYECLVENVFNIELIESELTSKCNSIQLNYGLSQKLSVGEFLQYFQKVENIIHIVQANQQKQQHKITQIFGENVSKISKLEENLYMIQKQWQRKKKIDQLQSQSIRNSIKQMIKKYQRVKNTLQVFQVEKQNINKSNMHVNPKNMTINKQLQIQKTINSIMQQMKYVQVFTQQMKCNIQELINKCNISQQRLQSFMETVNNINKNKEQQPSMIASTTNKTIENKNRNKSSQCKYVTFTQLRQVLSHLQHNLTTSLNNYVTNLLLNSNHQKHRRRQHKSTKQSHAQIFSQTQAHNQLQDSMQAQNNNHSLKQQKLLYEQPSVNKSDVSCDDKNLAKSNLVHQLTPSFNYRHFHSFQKSSRRQIVSQIEQNDIRQSIKLQWVYNYQNSSQISIVRVKQNPVKPTLNNNHHLSYSFSKQSSNLQSKKQLANPFVPLNSQQLQQSIQSSFYTVSNKSVIINQRGFYQIRCGLLPLFPIQIKIFCGGGIIASHTFNEIPKNNLCRAIMLYIRNYDEPIQITITCKPIDNQNQNDKDNGKGSNKKKYKLTVNNISQKKFQQPISGFICIQRLS